MMKRVVIADRTNFYDGRDILAKPLGGTETSVIYFAEAMARRGHEVTCLTRCISDVKHQGVNWLPIGSKSAPRSDLYLAVQHPDLFDYSRRARKRALWLMWPPFNLHRRRQALRLWLLRPQIVFASRFQVETYWKWLPRPDPPVVLALGLPDSVRGRPPLSAPPPPRAIFASNPMRNLKWLIELWGRNILPHVPGGELHIYGIRDYEHRFDAPWEETRQRLHQFIPDGYPESALQSLKPHPPAPRAELWRAIQSSRVMLYGGHRVEAFCLSVAEAQALGVPAVVRPIAVLPERVRHGETGFIAVDDQSFAEHAVTILTDDQVWKNQHEAALKWQQGWTWDAMAEEFERCFMDSPGHR